MSDCSSRGRKFDPGPVPYFRGDGSWNNIYGHSPPLIHSRRVTVSYNQKYVHEVLVNHLFLLAQEKSVVRWIDCPDMTLAVYWDIKQQTSKTMEQSVVRWTDCPDMTKAVDWGVNHQTRQTNKSRMRMWHLIRVSTVWIQNILLKFETNEKYYSIALKMAINLSNWLELEIQLCINGLKEFLGRTTAGGVSVKDMTTISQDLKISDTEINTLVVHFVLWESIYSTDNQTKF